MEDDEFIETVRREAPLESEDTARDVTAATMETLGERITGGEATDLADRLPDEVAESILGAPGEAEPFSLEEFTSRVSERAGVDETHAVEHGRAVATALSVEAGDELDAAREQLPSEFDLIFEPGGPVTEEQFVEAVRERADFDSVGDAERAITATLRALGEGLSGGEAADLGFYLSDSLAAELVDANDAATDHSFDEFVGLVAQYAGVERADAETYARAVGSVLAEAVSDRELDAARKQLPDPFGVVFESPDGTNDGS